VPEVEDAEESWCVRRAIASRASVVTSPTPCPPPTHSEAVPRRLRAPTVGHHRARHRPLLRTPASRLPHPVVACEAVRRSCSAAAAPTCGSRRKLRRSAAPAAARAPPCECPLQSRERRPGGALLETPRAVARKALCFRWRRTTTIDRSINFSIISTALRRRDQQGRHNWTPTRRRGSGDPRRRFLGRAGREARTSTERSSCLRAPRRCRRPPADRDGARPPPPRWRRTGLREPRTGAAIIMLATRPAVRHPRKISVARRVRRSVEPPRLVMPVLAVVSLLGRYAF
jgi:hypothetical protein